MQPSHPTPDPGAPPLEGDLRPEARAEVEPSKTGRAVLSAARLWSLALLVAVAVGAGSWYAAETTYQQFVVTSDGLPPEVVRDRAKLAEAMKVLTVSSQSKRAATAYAILGGTLGLGLGLAGGLARRSIGAALVCGTVGGVLGTAVGAGLSWDLVPRYYHWLDAATESEETNDVVRGLTVHADVWGAIGLVSGLALGMGAGGWKRILLGAIGGAMGAGLAAVTFDFIGVVVFPHGMTGLPVSPAWFTRLMAHGLVALFASIGATLFVLNLRPQPQLGGAAV